MPETLTFTLAEQKFDIAKPLPFGKLRIIEPLATEIFAEFKASADRKEAKRWAPGEYIKLATMIVTAVGKDKLDGAQLDNLNITPAQLFIAFATISDACCMFVKREDESKPGEASASIGDSSTQT